MDRSTRSPLDPPQGGLFVWLTVPEGLDTGPEGPLFPQCVAEGVLYVPGDYAFAPEPEPVPRTTSGSPSACRVKPT